MAELDPVQADLGATTRVPRHPAGRRHLDLDTELVAQPADQPDRVRPAGRPPGAPPAGPLPLAGQHHGQVQRLLGESLEQLGQLRVGRPPVDAVDRRRAAVDGERHRAGLEQRHSGGAAAEVAGSGPEQAGQQGRGVRRLLGRERVGQPDRVAQRVVDRQPHLVERGLAHEREADHLDTTGAGQGAADPPAQPLLTRETAAGSLAGQDRRDLVVADDPDDLLDQVVGVG
jgi:hypothetical protein